MSQRIWVTSGNWKDQSNIKVIHSLLKPPEKKCDPVNILILAQGDLVRFLPIDGKIVNLHYLSC